MADAVGGGGTTASVHNSPPNTHHVKALLATYAQNASLSLTGPSSLEDKAKQFNLAKDVVLRKVLPGEADKVTGFKKEVSYEQQNGLVNAMLNNAMLNKHIMMERERIRAVQEQYNQYSLAQNQKEERERSRQHSGQRSRQHSGQERAANHLSGEQIRKLRESQKEAERQQRIEMERRERQEAKGGQQTKSAFKPPNGLPPTSGPILSSNDKNWSDLEDTHLEGVQISCFSVGGEYRLCLPQILNSVLEKVSLQSINQACDELQIFCSTCSADQLQVLKDSKVLPSTAHQCGLITKSDAERLCSVLLDKNPPRASSGLFDPKASPFSFKVQHECFGGCEGLVLPEAYTSPFARCIECLQCEGLFAPHKFVCHSHGNTENRTCHWGFDSQHWRTYLQLSEDYTKEEHEKLSKVIEDFRNRYMTARQPLKRTQDDDIAEKEGASSSKRPKADDSSDGVPTDPYTANLYYSWAAKISAFRPWSPMGKLPFPGFPAGMQQLPYRNPSADNGHDLSKPTSTSRPTSTLDTKIDPSLKSPPPIVENCGKRKFVSDRDTSECRVSLAEEISAIQDALAGAPVTAKEAVLKILERLTDRVDKAERQRDVAVARYKELQTKYVRLEEELSKKRGELRELLRQDGGRITTVTQVCQGDKIARINRVGAARIDRVESARSGAIEDLEEENSQNSTSVILKNRERAPSGELDRLSERSLGSESSRLDNFSLASGLPKIELKSPARVIEEATKEVNGHGENGTAKEEEEVIDDEKTEEGSPRISESTTVTPRSRSQSSRSEGRSSLEEEGSTTACHDAKDSDDTRSQTCSPKNKAKAKESEDLKERMVTMEAELRALREELTIRSQSMKNNGTGGGGGPNLPNPNNVLPVIKTSDSK